MITQNPIIGRARKRIGGIYARTLYGKNVLQSCPPPTKGHQTKGQVAVCNAFGLLSKMSNQVTASLLNFIYYAAPVGRSRRAQWCKDLGTGMVKDSQEWVFDPSLIEILGGNPKVAETAFSLVPTSTRFEISVSSLSAVGNADINQVPCLILVCPSKNICIDLLPYTSLSDGTLTVEPNSTTLLNEECLIFPLWRVNMGTQANPIWVYGSFQKV